MHKRERRLRKHAVATAWSLIAREKLLFSPRPDPDHSERGRCGAPSARSLLLSVSASLLSPSLL